MYLTAEENGKILKIIKDNFDNAYILMECLAKIWGKERRNRKIHTANRIQNCFRGMELFSSAYRLLVLLPIAKKVTQKTLIFEKD